MLKSTIDELQKELNKEKILERHHEDTLKRLIIEKHKLATENVYLWAEVGFWKELAKRYIGK